MNFNERKQDYWKQDIEYWNNYKTYWKKAIDKDWTTFKKMIAKSAVKLQKIYPTHLSLSEFEGMEDFIKNNPIDD